MQTNYAASKQKCTNCLDRHTEFTCDKCKKPFCCYCMEKYSGEYFCYACAKKKAWQMYEMRDATDEMYVSVGIFHSLEDALEVLNNNDADEIGLVGSSDSYACIEIYARGYGLGTGKLVFSREYEQVYNEKTDESTWRITAEVRKE